jgi:hypothetical protein
MSKNDLPEADSTTVEKTKTGYKHPPAKSRFPKGKSGNPFGRRKGQRNQSTILIDILGQTVTVKQGDKSKRMSKFEAAIKVIMNKANNGDGPAIKGVSYLLEKIGRVDDINSETSNVGGVMLIPGVATPEEWKKEMAEWVKIKEAKDQQRKRDAPELEKKEAALRKIIALKKGTPEAAQAAADLADLIGSMEYASNFFIRRGLAPQDQETALNEVDLPKKEEPPAKLPFDGDEYARTRTHARKEYERTHE